MIEIDFERLMCDVIEAADDSDGHITDKCLIAALANQGLRYESCLRDNQRGHLVPAVKVQVGKETERKFRPGDLVVSKAGRYLTIECVGESGYGACGGDGLCFPFGYEDQWDLVRPAEKEDGV